MNSWLLEHVTMVNIALILTNCRKMGSLNMYFEIWKNVDNERPFSNTSANTGFQKNHFNQGSIDNWGRILGLKS